jgi:hypothetical protein
MPGYSIMKRYKPGFNNKITETRIFNMKEHKPGCGVK